MSMDVVNLIAILQIQFIVDDRHYLNTNKSTRVFVYLRIFGTQPRVILRRTLLCVRTSKYF